MAEGHVALLESHTAALPVRVGRGVGQWLRWSCRTGREAAVEGALERSDVLSLY